MAAAKRKPNAAFMKPVQPDDKLAAVVGSKPLPRTELTKKLWQYIKKHGLQDKKKRTLINADDALKAVFNGKKQVSMFVMTKLVSKHVEYDFLLKRTSDKPRPRYSWMGFLLSAETEERIWTGLIIPSRILTKLNIPQTWIEKLAPGVIGMSCM